jgi:nitrous oxidase accessory protein NosD
MRKTGLLWLGVLLVAIPASAQTKIAGKAHCAKPDPDQSVEVGDKTGHMLYLHKAECTWDGSQEIAGLKTKSGVDVETGEISGSTLRGSGYHTATMDNGDKYVVRFSGAATMANDNTGTIEGKWSFVSGTGKLKGIKGSGTYKGRANADGTGDVDVEGDYTVPAAKTTTKKK